MKEEFKCDICDQVFKTKSNLKRHYNQQHNNYEKVYNCIICTKIFKHQWNLAIHKRSIHGAETKYKCEPCSKSFSVAGNLKRHLHTVHEAHKDYKCESCGKSFSQAVHLKGHINTVHEGHKDYKCEYCGKLFSQAPHLKRHILTVHKGHNQYEVSNESFLEVRHLKNHNHTIHVESKKDYFSTVVTSQNHNWVLYTSYMKIKRIKILICTCLIFFKFMPYAMPTMHFNFICQRMISFCGRDFTACLFAINYLLATHLTMFWKEMFQSHIWRAQFTITGYQIFFIMQTINLQQSSNMLGYQQGHLDGCFARKVI